MFSPTLVVILHSSYFMKMINKVANDLMKIANANAMWGI